MRRRFRRGGALVLCAVLLTRCGSSDNPLDLGAIQQQLTECTQDGLVQMLLSLQNVNTIVDAITTGVVPDGVMVLLSPDVGDPPFTYVVGISYVGGAGVDPDQTLGGKITFSDDPLAGFTAGDSADFDLAILSQGGPWTGSVAGTWTVDSDTQVSITGTVDVASASSGCSSSFVFPEGSPLVVQDQSGFAPALAADFFGVEVFGSMDAIVEAGNHTLDALISILEGAQDATVDATIDGHDIDPFTIQLLPTSAEIQSLVDCLSFHGEALQFTLEQMVKVIEEIASPGTHPDVQITPTGLGTFDFVVTPSLVGTVQDQISGSVVAAPPPAASTVTWTMTLASESLLGNSVGPWSVVVPDGETPGTLTGAMQFTSTVEGCTTTITIPATDPLLFDLGGNFGQDGVLSIVTTQGDNEIRATYDFGAGDSGAFTLFSLNGIPLPASLLGFD